MHLVGSWYMYFCKKECPTFFRTLCFQFHFQFCGAFPRCFTTYRYDLLTFKHHWLSLAFDFDLWHVVFFLTFILYASTASCLYVKIDCGRLVNQKIWQKVSGDSTAAKWAPTICLNELNPQTISSISFLMKKILTLFWAVFQWSLSLLS